MDYKHLITANAEMAKIEERLSRYFVEGQAQHVIQRGNNRDIIFVCDKDYLFYLECLSEAATHHELMIHSYVLMTNHVHLLVTPETKESLPKVLQSVGRKYVQYFNYHYKRTGTLLGMFMLLQNMHSLRPCNLGSL